MMWGFGEEVGDEVERKVDFRNGKEWGEGMRFEVEPSGLWEIVM